MYATVTRAVKVLDGIFQMFEVVKHVLLLPSFRFIIDFFNVL